jgi:hypothetical protein
MDFGAAAQVGVAYTAGSALGGQIRLQALSGNSPAPRSPASLSGVVGQGDGGATLSFTVAPGEPVVVTGLVVQLLLPGTDTVLAQQLVNAYFVFGPPIPEPRDCLGHNPADVFIENLGATGFRIRAGSEFMFIVDDLADAQLLEAVVKATSQHCFLGRPYTGSDRPDYLSEYFQGPGPIPQLPGEDCIGYNPAEVFLENFGAGHFRLRTASTFMALAATQHDADVLLAVARRSTQQCFVGRDNTRPNRKDYIVSYWR